MIALACSLLLAVTPPASSEEVAAYKAAAATAGRDASAHVRLALWCEKHGMDAERRTHLALAVMAEPTNESARGLLGQVRDGGRWRDPADVGEKTAADARLAARLAEYNARKAETPNTADAQWKLAAWCDKQGLTAEARSHYTAVTRLDPRRDAAWARLGCKKIDGRWLSPEEIARRSSENRAREISEKRAVPRLAKLRAWLGDKKRHDVAEAALAAFTDPRAASAVMKVFGSGREADQAKAVQVLGQIDGPAASRELVVLALHGGSAEVRRAAIETLARRDARDFVPAVIEAFREVLKYEIRRVGGPGSPGVLFVEGKEYNVRRTYDPPPLPEQTRQFLAQRAEGVVIPVDTTEVRFLQATNPQVPADLQAGARNLQDRRQAAIVQNIAEAQKATAAAQQQMLDDAAAIDRANDEARVWNDGVRNLLSAATGTDLGSDRESWSQWWADQQGYAVDSGSTRTTMKPTFDQAVPLNYAPNYIQARTHSACFAEGTPVTTRSGLRPIESIKVGDDVLTRDVASGKLQFAPVVAAYHNKPAATLDVKIGDETIVATGIHRFWKAGHGWVMARDLKPGDSVRTVNGTETVRSVSPNKVQPVFNLEVAAGHNFFVGQTGALVHDYTHVQPSAEPFDAVPALARLTEE